MDMTGMNRSQRVSLIAMFTALAVILNFALAVPVPYAAFLSYEVWEVPILVAVILMGLWSGLTIAALNTLVLELHPGALPTGPVYNLVAELSMILGVVVARRIARGADWGPTMTWVSVTLAGAGLRTAVMTVVNAAVLPQPYPLGFSLPASLVPSYLVPIGFFNFTLTLYTVPLAYSIARAILSRYRPVFATDMSL